MLAIHWSPVNNTKRIKKNGIRKNKNGLYCFPLTGNHYVDKYWVDMFNVSNKKEYNGFIFKLEESDMPAYFGDWFGATNKDKFEKEITDLKTLKKEFKNNFLYRLGQSLAYEREEYQNLRQIDLIEIAENEIRKETVKLSKLLTDIEFLNWSMEHLQIVISKSIDSKRIIKIIGKGDTIGRIKKEKIKDKISLKEMKNNLP